MTSIEEQLGLPPLTPTQQRNMERRVRVWRFQYQIYRLMPWLRGPVINVVTTFWLGIAEEGLLDTAKPRWGAMTFCYLNDGIRPTIYHTVMSVLHSDTPIYPMGAPRNRAEALAPSHRELP